MGTVPQLCARLPTLPQARSQQLLNEATIQADCTEGMSRLGWGMKAEGRLSPKASLFDCWNLEPVLLWPLTGCRALGLSPSLLRFPGSQILVEQAYLCCHSFCS